VSGKALKKAKTSLENMFEMLGPYLPKTDLEEPDPGREWSPSSVDDCLHSEPASRADQP
jgi:hypothetical protein